MKIEKTIKAEKLKLILDNKDYNKLLKVCRDDSNIKLIIETMGQDYIELKHYMAELQDFVDNMPEWAARNFWQIVVGDLAINGRPSKYTLHLLIKEVIGEPSFSFAAMPSQAKRTKFKCKAFEQLDRWRACFYA